MNFPGFSHGELTQRELFDSAIVALSMTRADTSFVAVNDAYARLFGYDSPRALMEAAPLATDLYVDAEDRSRVVAAVEKNGSVSDFEVRMRRRDGAVRWMSIGMSAIRDAEGALIAFHAALFDVTEKRAAITASKRDEALLRLEQQVTLRFAQARNAGAALQAAIRAICETERWEAGRYLEVDTARNVLYQSEAWCVPVAGIQRYIDESQKREYAPGVGLVGHVWQTGEPLWVPDISKDRRVARPHLAGETGMRGSVVFPVHAEGKTIGVFIFDSREIRKPDARLMRTLSLIGGQVGLLVRRAQAEEAMRESEARFRSLTALSADWYWEQDAQFRLTFMSQQMGEKTGLPPGAYLGGRRWDQPALNLDEEGWAAHRAQLERHEPFQDFEMQRPDGRGGSRWISLTGEPVFDADGRFAGYRGIGKDITERKREQDILALEHTVTRCLAESDSVPGALHAVMRTVCEMRGWECGRYFAKDAGVFKFSGHWYGTSRELDRFIACSAEKSFPAGVGMVGRAGAGESIWVEDLADEARVVSGPVAEEPGMRAAFMFPVVAGNEVLGVLSFTSRSIREPEPRLLAAVRVIGSQVGQFLQRKHAETILREGEARFRSLVELSSDWYWEQDAEFRFTRFDGPVTERSGNHPSGALGKRRWEISSIIPLSTTWEEHRALLEARKPFRGFEYSRVGDDGELRYLEASGEPVFDAQGRFAGYRGLAADITERKRAQEDREKIGRMYAALSALNELVAHAKTADELLKGACEIAVSSGDFRYALVRMADETKGVAPIVACAGPEQAPWLNRPLSLDPASPDAESLAVRAYLLGQAVQAVGDDLTNRVLFRQMHEKTGTRAAGAYPLHRGGMCVGSLLLNSGDAHAFEGEMGELLARMARNVSQGLDLLQAGEELRRFRLAVDQCADMMALVDCETMRYLDVNDTMCKALGYGRAELLAMHPYDLLPMTREELAVSYRSLIDGPGHAGLLSEYRRKDGSVMPIESFRSVMHIGGRRVIVANARDISERVGREHALARLTRMYAALSSLNETIPRLRDAREVLQQACEIASASGHFVRAAVRLLDRETGRTRAVAWSGPGSSELAHFSATIDPAFPEGRSLVAEALRSGETRVSNDYLNDQHTYLIRGTPAAEGTRSVGAFPLREAGQVTGVLILHGLEAHAFDDDMCALLERMAQSLSFALENLEAESRFRQTFEASGSGIAHVGLDGRYLRVNPALCEMLGYTAAELVGRSVKDISHPDDRDVSDPLREPLRRGEVESVRLEKRYLRRDGSVVWIALTIALARDAHGAPSYEISIYEDVTRRKRDERLMQLEHTVTRRLAEAETESAGVQGLIRAVCEANGWPVGRYFVPDTVGRVLRFAEGWASTDPNAEQFLAASRSTTYAPGVGLTGWVWQNGEPLWVADVARDPRTMRNARPASFKRGGAMVFPVAAGGATLGVLSFSRPDATPPDERLLKAMGVIAAQLGQFVVKKRGEEERAAMRERDQSLVRALGEIIYDWRPLEGSLRWEGEHARILGYAEMGNDTESWLSRVHPEDLELVTGEVEAATLERRNYDLQYRFRRADGHYAWMHDRGVCSFDAQGRLTRIIGVLADISARKKTEQALRGIVQASAEPLLLVRKDGTAQFVNPAAEALFGRSASELEGAMLGLPLADGRPAEVDIVLPGGGLRPAEMQFASTELEGQELLVVSLHDLSERKRYESHIEHLANHDALTSLPNRTLLRDRVEQAIVHARRAGGHVGLMFVDLDQFKLVNDSWGHAVGDLLLLEVAQRLQRTVRDGDTVARLGGDEFVVLLPDLSRADNTSVVARKVAEALEKPLMLDGRETRITASIGIALFPDDGADLDSLLQCADAAMYRAKDAGRNGYQYYSADMGTQARARVDTESGLRLALERDELRLHYQPQVELQGGVVKGIEALMRWDRPGKGMVSPMDFIPVAEESGLILPMGDWALMAACRQAKAWSAGGLGTLTMAVNLSARQFWRGSVTEAVRKALGESGLAPSQLEIEITESVVARDLQNVMLQLEQLRRMGVSIAIDDFGTGYSSLAYLRSLPINKLKIDKSFIKGIPADREATALVAEIVRLAHILSLEVVAEGVETMAQASFLRECGCEAMQGYLFARPLPAPECSALLRAGRSLTIDAG